MSFVHDDIKSNQVDLFGRLVTKRQLMAHPIMGSGYMESMAEWQEEQKKGKSDGKTRRCKNNNWWNVLRMGLSVFKRWVR